MRGARELLIPLEHDNLERLFGAEVLPDQLFDITEECIIVENRPLNVEDRRFLRTCRALDAIPNLREPLVRAFPRLMQPRDLPGNLLIANDAVPDLGNLPAQEMHRADDNAGRRGIATKLPIH